MKKYLILLKCSTAMLFASVVGFSYGRWYDFREDALWIGVSSDPGRKVLRLNHLKALDDNHCHVMGVRVFQFPNSKVLLWQPDILVGASDLVDDRPVIYEGLKRIRILGMKDDLDKGYTQKELDHHH